MSKTDLWRAIWSKKVQVLSLVLASLVFSPMMALAAGGELLKKSDMEYQGAFKMTDDTLGGSRFGYGGRGLAPYRDPDTGKSTLFMEGHAWYPGQVAQLEIPKDFSKWFPEKDPRIISILGDRTSRNWQPSSPTRITGGFNFSFLFKM